MVSSTFTLSNVLSQSCLVSQSRIISTAENEDKIINGIRQINLPFFKADYRNCTILRKGFLTVAVRNTVKGYDCLKMKQTIWLVRLSTRMSTP
jgi:hypothetical protein